MKIVSRLTFWALWLSEHLIGSERFHWRRFRNRFYLKYVHPQVTEPNSFRSVEIVEGKRLDRALLGSLPKDRPVVIRGLVDGAACLAKWDWDYIRSHLAEKELPYIDTYTSDKFHSGKMKGEAILSSILSDKPRYSILFSNLKRDSKSLIQDLEARKWMDEKAFSRKLNQSWQIFLAGKGRETKLHSELGTTVSMQISGRKKWLLFSPDQSVNINPKVNWKMYLESNQLSGYAEVRESSLGLALYEVELQPGDVLYFPACFWHVIQNVSESISVSFKWTDVRSFFALPRLSLILLTSRNPAAIFRLPFLRRFSTTYPPTG